MTSAQTTSIQTTGIPTTGALLSARQAAAVLAELGVSRASARRALLAGVAGPGIRLQGSLVYDEARVRALVRPSLLAAHIATITEKLVFVGRIGEDTIRAGELLQLADGLSADEALRRAASSGWRMSEVTAAVNRLQVNHIQPIPFIGLVGGFVAVGGEIKEVRAEPDGTGKGTFTFTLEAPGPWFDHVASRHVAMSFRARWTTLGPPPR